MTASSFPTRLKAGLWLAAFALASSSVSVKAQAPPDGAEPPALKAPEFPAPSPLQPPGPNAQPQPGTPPATGHDAPGKGGPPVDTAEQHIKLLDELYARLATAPDQATANQIAQAIEQLWQHSGSATADLLVARAGAAVEAQNRELAMKLLNAAVELQPDYVEAWNRRAYLFYLDNDYKRALGDLRRVLALDPHHFKALEGLANLLVHLGEKKAALEAYNVLLKVHPNLPDAKKSRDDLVIEVEGQGI